MTQSSNRIISEWPDRDEPLLLIAVPSCCRRYAWRCWTRTTWHRRGTRDHGNLRFPRRHRPIPSSRFSRPTIRTPLVLWPIPYCRIIIIIILAMAATPRTTTMRRRINLNCIRPPATWDSPEPSTGKQRRDTCWRCEPTMVCNIGTLFLIYRWERVIRIANCVRTLIEAHRMRIKLRAVCTCWMHICCCKFRNVKARSNVIAVIDCLIDYRSTTQLLSRWD